MIREPAEPESGTAGRTRSLAAVVVPILTTLLAIPIVLFTTGLALLLSEPDICFDLASQGNGPHKQACADARATHDMTAAYTTAGLAVLQLAVAVGAWVLRRTAWALWAAVPALLALAGAVHLVGTHA